MSHPVLIRAILGAAGLAGCLALLSGVARAADFQPAGAVAPNLFGTLTLPVKAARYYDDWERARRDDSSDPRMRALIAPALRMTPDQQISYIQGAVYRWIRWMSDATEWGQHDYWASAAETLEHGAGDMEDRAIVKMQALRALGFSTRDLYLTMGRDKVGGPITVLIVRLGARYYMLDDDAGAPFTTDKRPEFKPLMTFGYGGSWVHGYPALAQKRAPAPRAATAFGSWMRPASAPAGGSGRK
jgi:predicted transglutaminase-like cysteine proteinase